MLCEVPILVARQERRTGAAWRGARSWFGGLPKLGGLPWPRGKDGRPLVFAAQIDLAEIAPLQSVVAVPKTGSLAFFISEGAVVYVPPGGDTSDTTPPSDLPPAIEPEGDLFPQRPSPWAHLTFPYWPASVAALDVGETRPEFDDEDAVEAADAAMVAAVDAAVPGRGQFFGGSGVAPMLTADGIHGWWRAVTLYAEQIKIAAFYADYVFDARRPALESARAAVAKLKPTPKPLFGLFGRKTPDADPALAKAEAVLATHEARDAALRAQVAALPGFIDEVERFAAGQNPWAAMPKAAFDAFAALHQRGRTQFGDVVRYRTSSDTRDLMALCATEMATGDEAAYAALSPRVREAVNGGGRLPQSGWHQMFGRGVNIQGNPMMELDDHLMVLQLTYDDLMRWRFGDMGAFQFYISDKDLAAGKWDKAVMTFECH